jgi:hypothetical protein
MLKTALLILPLFLMACGDRGAVAGDTKAAAQAPAKAPESAAALDPTAVSGTVLETMDAGAYTYVRLKTANGETWAAVNRAALARGAEITVGNAMWMENFESKTLNRKFDRILFGMIGSAPSLDAMAAAAELPAGHPETSSAAASASQVGDILGDAKVDKATGKDARTVAEIWAQRKELSGREVVIRARVVKFNPEIMGKNWIHLRDGSGSAEKGDNDLTVTTDAVVAKGDIVNVRGKVAIDRDFTAGYAYPVIIEEAKVIK